MRTATRLARRPIRSAEATRTSDEDRNRDRDHDRDRDRDRDRDEDLAHRVAPPPRVPCVRSPLSQRAALAIWGGPASRAAVARSLLPRSLIPCWYRPLGCGKRRARRRARRVVSRSPYGGHSFSPLFTFDAAFADLEHPAAHGQNGWAARVVATRASTRASRMGRETFTRAECIHRCAKPTRRAQAEHIGESCVLPSRDEPSPFYRRARRRQNSATGFGATVPW